MTRRRHAVLLLAALPLFAACSSGSDGADDAADPAPVESSSGGDDGDVVTRNPSESGEADELTTTGGDTADAPGDSAATGGADAAATGGESGTTGGDTSAGDDGGSAAGDDTGGSATTGADGGAATGDGAADDGSGGGSLDDDPLADLPLDQIESIEDDTGLVIVDIPIAWIEVDGTPDGDLRQLRASIDLAAFDSGFATEGIALAALDVESGTADWEPALNALSTAAADAGCTALGEEVYDDAVYRGLERTYDCPGTDLDVSLFGGTNEDSSTEWTLKLITQAGDAASRQLVFQSFLLD